MNDRFNPKPLHLASVDSTNSWMLQKGKNCPDWAAIYTLNQTHGRGRRGRMWKSHPGDTLAMSLRVPSLPAHVSASWIPLLAGFSLVCVLKNLGLDSVQVKWPNDVLVGSLKLSGTLVEVAVDGALIVGMGINVFSPVADLPDPNSTSLAIEGLEIADGIESLVVAFRSALQREIAEGLACHPRDRTAFWSERVRNSLATIGSFVEVVGDDGITRKGTALDLGPSGELLVRADNGHIFAVNAGDVFHIPRS